MRGRQRAHRAGADDDGAAAGQRAQPGVGHVERHRHHGCARGVDTGLGVHPLADRQRALGQFVQRAADGVVGLGGGVGAADLAEHLLLADHRGVQAAGDGEQMLDGGLGVADVGVLGQIAQRHPGVLGQAPDRSPRDRRGRRRRRRRPRRGCRWTAPWPRSPARTAAPRRRSWPDRTRRCSIAPARTPARCGAKPRKATRSWLHHHAYHAFQGSRLPAGLPNLPNSAPNWHSSRPALELLLPECHFGGRDGNAGQWVRSVRSLGSSTSQ